MVTYNTLCGQVVTESKTNNSFEKTDCEQCLRILLIKENDRLAKIAERLREVERMPKVLVGLEPLNEQEIADLMTKEKFDEMHSPKPRLPKKPYFL